VNTAARWLGLFNDKSWRSWLGSNGYGVQVTVPEGNQSEQEFEVQTAMSGNDETSLHRRTRFTIFWSVGPFLSDSPLRFQWSPHTLTDASWILFCGVWLIAARGAKSASRQESSGERLSHIIFMAAGFALFYYPAPSYLTWLGRSFVPGGGWIDWLGAWLTLTGVLFAIWARVTIGKEWSGEVQIKQGHRLIRSGPYAHIRHPIYTGLLLALSGTALAIDEYRALIGLVVICLGFARKAKKEESFLAEQFGPAFEDHRRHTGFFLPRFS
jgi:protein-S-isoprenylcysteine O-methyltransferase Ste14